METTPVEPPSSEANLTIRKQREAEIAKKMGIEPNALIPFLDALKNSPDWEEIKNETVKLLRGKGVAEKPSTDNIP